MNSAFDWMKAKQKAGANKFSIGGMVKARVLDRFGRPMTDWIEYPNGAVTVGINKMLDVNFRNQTQIAAWYIGLIDGSGFSEILASDTMASHAGWTELTAYSGNRQAWSPGAAASGVLSISSALSFTMTGDSDIQGIFIASSATKGETASTLWATAVEGSPRTITTGNTYQVLYSITCTATS